MCQRAMPVSVCACVCEPECEVDWGTSECACGRVIVHVRVCVCKGGRVLGQGALGAHARPTVRHLVTAPAGWGQEGLPGGCLLLSRGIPTCSASLLTNRPHPQAPPPSFLLTLSQWSRPTGSECPEACGATVRPLKHKGTQPRPHGRLASWGESTLPHRVQDCQGLASVPLLPGLLGKGRARDAEIRLDSGWPGREQQAGR